MSKGGMHQKRLGTTGLSNL